MLDEFYIPNYVRKWDTSEYERIARERIEKLRKQQNEDSDDDDDELDEKAIKRTLLQARDYKVDLESRLGKSVIVTKATPASDAGGYYCNVCDCVVKDSINFLDHINGKKHQRNMGMSMKVERSSVDQVRDRIKLNKQKQDQQEKEYDFEERMKELKEEEEKLKAYRRERRKESKKRKFDDAQGDDDESDLAAVMGFSGFGGAKK
ncbi:unnamed protein product [Didymodactylos carnosus]|uniref:U1-type domain-containing protein n=2 Tax=Didymodactylos carnosus TaxID=1234261 RepID=A0A813PI31_9BILA|nr:unnamed protein product [Didymodactylos carnosus]CAF3530352.1 unnamed protein product [Didymodactylos carnosus]